MEAGPPHLGILEMTEQRANAELWEAPVTNNAAGGCVMAEDAQRRIGKKLAQFYGGITGMVPVPPGALTPAKRIRGA